VDLPGDLASSRGGTAVSYIALDPSVRLTGADTNLCPLTGTLIE
jgi:hypothetical protein